MAGSGSFGVVRPYSGTGSGTIAGGGGFGGSTSRTSSAGYGGSSRISGGMGSTASTSGPQFPQFPDFQMPTWQMPPMPQVQYTPSPMNLQAQRDPYLDQTYQDYQAYRGQLAAGADQDAINAMQRQRDLTSGMMAEGESNAAMRGIGPETGASQYLQQRTRQQGLESAAGLNANMASDARRQQLSALGGQAGAAGAGAAALLGQQNYALNQWQAQQQAAQAQAALQVAQQNQSFNNMLAMSRLQLEALQPFYSGLF